MGGTQSLHTNGFDEALSLPTENADSPALRTQQIVAFESGITDTPDPLAGSYFIESLTEKMYEEAELLIQKIDAMGGAVSAIEQGFMQDEIAKSSYAYTKAIENNEKIIVGVNKFTTEEEDDTPILKIDESIRTVQSERLAALRAKRNNDKVKECLEKIKTAAEGTENLMPLVIEAVENLYTLGEISHTLRRVWGEYSN